MAVAIVVIVIVIVLLAAVGGTLLLRRRALRRRFGPEYDRLAAKVGERRAAAELSERQRRIAQLNIRPLSAERRAAYDAQWAGIQEQFVDGPARAAEAAGALVTAVAADRGYEVADRDRLLTDLSVYHADQLDGYRRALAATGQASTAPTEDLREAMLAYRGMLRELLEAPDGASQRQQATEPTPPVPPTPPLTPPPAPPTPQTPRTPRTPEPDDADAPRTGTGAWADIAAGTGARAGGDGHDGSEGSLDDRSASQATRKE